MESRNIIELKEGMEYLQNEIEMLKKANNRFLVVQKGLQEEMASVQFLMNEMRNNKKDKKNGPAEFTMKCLKHMKTIKMKEEKRKKVYLFLTAVEREYAILIILITIFNQILIVILSKRWQVYIETHNEDCTMELNGLFERFTKDIQLFKKRHFFRSPSDPFSDSAPYLF